MAMNVGGSGSKVAPVMNVTPLVDVVLVLLIIFMVVTPLLTKKFWLNVPKKNEKTEQQPPPDNQKPVVLTYHTDGTIKLQLGAGPQGRSWSIASPACSRRAATP